MASASSHEFQIVSVQQMARKAGKRPREAHHVDGLQQVFEARMGSPRGEATGCPHGPTTTLNPGRRPCAPPPDRYVSARPTTPKVRRAPGPRGAGDEVPHAGLMSTSISLMPRKTASVSARVVAHHLRCRSPPRFGGTVGHGSGLSMLIHRTVFDTTFNDGSASNTSAV